MIHEAIARYTRMIKSFLTGSTDARTFEHDYLQAFKNESVTLPTDVFETLDRLFADVDAYCPDPALRGTDDLDEQQLRGKCREALTKLEKKKVVSSGPARN